jgi:hypothetical protein
MMTFLQTKNSYLVILIPGFDYQKSVLITGDQVSDEPVSMGLSWEGVDGHRSVKDQQ